MVWRYMGENARRIKAQRKNLIENRKNAHPGNLGNKLVKKLVNIEGKQIFLEKDPRYNACEYQLFTCDFTWKSFKELYDITI